MTKIRTLRHVITTTATVSPENERHWDDLDAILRTALQSIALDNTEDRFPDVIVEVEP